MASNKIYSKVQKSIDSGYNAAKDSEQPDHGNQQPPPQAQQGATPAPSLVTSTVITYSSGASGASGSGGPAAPETGPPIHNGISLAPDACNEPEVENKPTLESSEANSSFFSTNKKGVISQESTTYSHAGMPTLETAEEAGMQPSGVFGFGEDSEAAANTEGLTMEVPAAELSAPTASCPMSSSSSEQDEVIHQPKEEERSSNATGTEMVGLHDKDTSVQDMKSEIAENQNTIHKLQENLKQTTLEKEKAEQETLIVKQRYEQVMKEKDAEISKLKDQVEQYEQCISNLEKTNEMEREKYKSDIQRLKEKIQHLKEEMESKEKERKMEISDLKYEIVCKKLKISQMETQEENLRRQLAEAKLTIQEDKTAKAEAKLTIAEGKTAKAEAECHEVKKERDTLKEECDTLKEERDAAKELERTSSNASTVRTYSNASTVSRHLSTGSSYASSIASEVLSE